MDTTLFEMKDIYKAYLTFSSDTGLAGLGPDDMDQPSDGEGNIMGIKIGPNSFGWNYYANALINDAPATPALGSANLAYNSDNKFYYRDSDDIDNILATESYVIDKIADIGLGSFNNTALLYANSSTTIATDLDLVWDAANNRLKVGANGGIGKLSFGSAPPIGDVSLIIDNDSGGVGYYVKNIGSANVSDSYFQAVNANSSQDVRLVAKNAAASEHAYVGTASNSPFDVVANNIKALTIYTDGKVGINQLIPTADLDIHSVTNILLNIQSDHATDSSAGITLRSKKSSTSVVSQFYNVSDLLHIGTTSAHDLRIETQSNSRIYIKNSDGFIGMGTDTPSFALHIKQTANDAKLYIETTNGGNEAGVVLNRTLGGGAGAEYVIKADNSVVLGTTNNFSLLFETNSVVNASLHTDGIFEVLNNGIKTADPGGGSGVWELGTIIPCLSVVDITTEVLQVRVSGGLRYINLTTPTF